MKELGVRLSAVAKRIRQGARVADIGTDHALLPVWLLQNGQCPSAVASDIGEGPAAAARRTVSGAGLEAAISVRVGDGLAPVQPDEVDDIVIAGMGGETIADILAAAPWVADARYRLVLQPMSKPERLRTFLAENGFSTVEEDVVAEGERLYTVMTVTFTGERRRLGFAEALMGDIPHSTDGVRHMEKLGGRIAEHLAGLPLREEYESERRNLAMTADAVAAWLKNS